ncbi:MAG: hypothetical protein FJY86_01855 [Candidatus Diapherotrites archaeon]|uniref:Uncharacterized protein n=1 Tax=Candidatus Iainarchaeum sp. TaxID=3101447 RepID=A0A8T4C702_9ARCH|nr:hypothetical protein [Candidatus Diapherotrites archaeon]
MSIPLSMILILGTVFGLFFFNYFQKKFQWKWLGASLATGIVFFTIILFIIHSVNLFSAYALTDSSSIPADIRNDPLFQADQPNPLILFVSAFIQSLFSGIVLALISLPFLFGGVALFDALRVRVKGVWSRLALICFLASGLMVILLSFFPWLLVSLVYMVYWGW